MNAAIRQTRVGPALTCAITGPYGWQELTKKENSLLTPATLPRSEKGQRARHMLFNRIFPELTMQFRYCSQIAKCQCDYEFLMPLLHV